MPSSAWKKKKISKKKKINNVVISFLLDPFRVLIQYNVSLISFNPSKLIKENVRTDDIVARIGGDEYVVLFPDISRDELKTIYERIKKSFDSYTSSHRVPWSISISFAMNEETGGNISKAITLAEDRVYLENLGKNYSSYSLVAKKILKKFTEVRDDITNHLHLDSLTVRFSRKLSLPDERVDDLRLLSEFHDIGKVGIPDELLFKPDKLKKEEKRIMKRHPEIGYRIAPPQNFDILQNDASLFSSLPIQAR